MELLRLFIGDAKTIEDRLVAIKLFIIIIGMVYIYDLMNSDDSLFDDMSVFFTTYLPLMIGLPMIWMKKNMTIITLPNTLNSK